MRLLPLAVLLAVLLALPTPVAEASGRGIHYGMNAKKVSKKLHCRGAYRPESTAAAEYHIKDGVVCRIKGKRVNVITFRDSRGQTRWEDDLVFLAIAQGYPEHWASANGVGIVARNGNRKAACVGFRALRGARNVGAYRATDEGWTRLRC